MERQQEEREKEWERVGERGKEWERVGEREKEWKRVGVKKMLVISHFREREYSCNLEDVHFLSEVRQ